MMSVEKIECYYGRVKVLKGISLDVGPGEVVALLGRNGAGKTTLMKTIVGLVPAESGTVELAGARVTDVPVHRRRRS